MRAGATGDNSGLDWENAYTAVPAQLVRGATYYVAAGTYGVVTVDTPDSGTAVVTIKGATVAEHGTGSGWSSAYSVRASDGGGAAQFPDGWSIATDYVAVDGAVGGGSEKLGATTGYGFVSRSDAAGSGAIGFAFTKDLVGISISHYEIDGVAADDIAADANGTDGMLCVGGCNVDGLFDHLYIHDVKRTCFLMGGNVTLQHSLLARNRSTPQAHGEGWSYRGGTAIIRFNIFEDIRGTGQFVELYGTGTNHEVYGNVFREVVGPCEGCNDSAWPTVDNTNQGVIHGLKFYNNTIYGLGGNSGVGIINESTGYDVRNNLWFQSGYGASISGIEDYNHVWGTYLYGTSPGPHDSWRCFQANHTDPSGNCAGNNALDAPSASQLFVASPGDLHVNGAIVAGQSMAGVNLGAPYDVDMDGVKRVSWTRGAYE